MNILRTSSSSIQGGHQYQIDWTHPISYGLNYVRVCNNLFTAPAFTKFPIGALTNTGPCYLRSTAGGVGIVSDVAGSAGWLSSAAGSLTVSQAAGTALAFTTFGLNINAWNDRGTRFLFTCFNPSNYGIGCLQYGFATWGYGWTWPGNSGHWSTWGTAPDTVPGKPIIMGMTWDSSVPSQAIWVDKFTSNNTSAFTTGDTSSNVLNIGGYIAGQSWLGAGTNSAIHWFAYWDRVLSNSEIIYLNTNPMCFLIPAEYEMSMLYMPSSFIPAWAAQSNLPVIGAGTF